MGRSRSPVRRTGTTSGSARKATPAVIPQASQPRACDDSSATSCWFPSASVPNRAYTPMTTMLDTSGENACQKNRFCACSIPPSTTARP
ncbi:hypothetical protein ISCU110981_20230 [Isoptericola cucumis]